jgi:hypothetical protein
MSTKDTYDKEKAAVRLYEFYKRFDDLLAVYVELKLYYPKLAEMVEKQYPFLVSMYDTAVQQFRNRSDTVNELDDDESA